MDELAKSLPEIIKQAAASTLGILALMIIGLAILAFFFFRGASEKARMIIFVMLFFGVVAFGAAVVWKATVTPVPSSSSAPTPKEEAQLALMASIWKVEMDQKGAMLATKEFSSGAGVGVPVDSIKEFADWVSNQLELTAAANGPKVHLKVQVPANLKSEKPIFERTPSGQMDVLLWDERASAKGRSPLTWEALKDIQTPFQIEIRIPGRRSTVIEATPGTAFTKELDVEPLPVRIGVEKFTGPEPDRLTGRVCNELKANPLIQIVDPVMLETIRTEMEEQREKMRLYPMAQIGVRSLGIDYIISGGTQAKTP